MLRLFIDDIVLYGYDLNDHNRKLVHILELLRKFNLKLQAKKCHFLKKEIVYLGHIITTSGIKADPSIINAVVNFSIPKNQTHIRSFYSLASFYRKFIENFSKIAQPLSDCLGKNKTFNWDCHCSNAFNNLTFALTNAPVLQYPDFKKQFILSVDASDFAIGAVLSQKVEPEDEDLPIAYASRVLNSAERHYATIKKELLAIVFAVKRFRPYMCMVDHF